MKVSELQGPALDWAVAQCEGIVWEKGDLDAQEYGPGFEPSTNWAHGGPIIDREEISIERITSALWTATLQSGPAVSDADGPTPLIAAMRSYVASCLGDEVNVPEEL